MGFPIKKRIDVTIVDEANVPSGLDLLSAAIYVTPNAPPQNLQQGITPASDGEDCSSVNSTPASQVSENVGKTFTSTSKRAKTFPELLLEIISDPDNASIVSWLPNGKSFAVHDQGEFMSKILHKHFRRVIFRSFVRKLNRWGFRSVKRSVSGFDSTFEHEYFCRDRPELISKMYCRSNPSSTMSQKNNSAKPVGTKFANPSAPVVSRSTSSSSVSNTSPLAMLQAPQLSPTDISPSVSAILRNEDTGTYGADMLLLRELQERQMRREALMKLIQGIPPREGQDGFASAGVTSFADAAMW